MSKYASFILQGYREIVRLILEDVAQNGLQDNSYFYITVDTSRKDVILPDFVRAKYPEQISLVLQHQFSNLKVGSTAFQVELSFGGVPTTLSIPYEALIVFADPAHDFALPLQSKTPQKTNDPGTDGVEAPSKGADIIRLTPKKKT